MNVTLIQVEELIEYADEMSDDFDTSFLESIRHQLRCNNTLSANQERAINNIQDAMIKSLSVCVTLLR